MAQKNTPALIIARESREGLWQWPGPRRQDQDSSFGQSPLGFTNKSDGTSVTSSRGYSDCQPWLPLLGVSVQAGKGHHRYFVTVLGKYVHQLVLLG